ncbi:MAG: hypothetical protein NC222_06835 [Staphylococcus sp.]|nr:hypothetical protein [Staphylococcus sp.]
MNKYLIVYQHEYKKQISHYSYVKVEDIKNDFVFCEELPSYSLIINKLIKKHKCRPEELVIINIIAIKSEPNDLEAKEVVKL